MQQKERITNSIVIRVIDAKAITICRETLIKCPVRRWDLGERERFGESVADLLVQLKELGLLDEFRAAVRLPCPGSAWTK